MSQIPRITRSDQASPIAKRQSQQNQQISELKKQPAHQKTATGTRTDSYERKNADVSFTISSDPSISKIEAQTPLQQSAEIIQVTYSGLETVGNILSNLLEIAKLMQSQELPPELKKDMKIRMLRLLNEIDYIAVNTKSNNISILGNITGEIIRLFGADGGKAVDLLPYNVTTEELGIRALVQKLEEDGVLEQLITAVEKSIVNIASYQSELAGISKQLGIEENLRKGKISISILPDEAREMSNLTRALILSSYGVTFFSGITQRIKNFSKAYDGFILFGIVVILIALLAVIRMM